MHFCASRSITGPIRAPHSSAGSTRSGDALDEFVVVVIWHDEAGEGAAFLSEAGECAMQEAEHGLVLANWAGVKDTRLLPPEATDVAEECTMCDCQAMPAWTPVLPSARPGDGDTGESAVEGLHRTSLKGRDS